VLSADTIAAMADAPYAEIAETVLRPFLVEAFPDWSVARRMIAEAYASFRHPSVTPLAEIGPGRYVLELFHGPTLSFKDIAMQLLARLVDQFLAARGARATIVGATSGDTGSAAINAFRGRERIDIFILHPKGRTSAIQRQQMTTVLDENVHNIAIEGTFDDCQRLLKGMFGNRGFREEIGLSGVNSINFGRIAAQIVYYFKAAAQLGAPHRPVSFTVPTGNFGDIFAGYAAKRMGLPIERLVIATNSNDILARTLETGTYQTEAVVPTASPSMDIQVSSNFERLLFEATGRDGAAVGRMMSGLTQSGGFTLPATALEAIRADFAAGRASEEDVMHTIGETLHASRYLADPHTAVGLAVAQRQKRGNGPMVTLATAHPAKFPDAVRAATGIEPQLPVWLADLGRWPERYDVLPDDQRAVEDYIRSRARVVEAVQ
jgi:threonine synthase